MPTWLARLAVALTLGVIGSFTVAAPAWAHGDGETDEGYLLVQQALGHLAHDTSATGIDLAMEKVQDALDTADQEGVDVVEVEQGMAALDVGNVDLARSLLQDSIREAVQGLPPATGSQTGTTTVSPGLPGRSGMHAQDWFFLAASVVVLLVGAGLAFVFRPPDSVRVLRTRLAAPGPGPGPAVGQGGD